MTWLRPARRWRGARQEATKIVEEAHTQARTIIEEANRQVEAQRLEVINQARQEAQEIIARAQKQAERQHAERLISEREEVIQMALAAASRLVQEELDDDKHRQLIQEFVGEVDQKEAALPSANAEQPNLPPIDAEVQVAIALLPEEERSLQEALQRRFGRPLVLHVEVKPSILGGVWVRVGDSVIDGSLHSHLQEMQRYLFSECRALIMTQLRLGDFKAITHGE